MRIQFEAATLAKALRPLEAHLPRLTEHQRSVDAQTRCIPYTAALFIDTVAPDLCRLTAFSKEDRFVSVYAKGDIVEEGGTSLPWDCAIKLLKSMTRGPYKVPDAQILLKSITAGSHKIPDALLLLKSSRGVACELRAGRLTMNLIGAGRMPDLPAYVEGAESIPLAPPAAPTEQLVSRLTAARKKLATLEPFRSVSPQAREKFLRAYLEVRVARQAAASDKNIARWQATRAAARVSLLRDELARGLMPQKLLPESAMRSHEALDAAIRAEDTAEVERMPSLMAESDAVAGRIDALKAELAAFEKAWGAMEDEREAAQRVWFKANNAGDSAVKEAAYAELKRAHVRQTVNVTSQGILQTKIDELSRIHAGLGVRVSLARAAQARLQMSAAGS